MLTNEQVEQNKQRFISLLSSVKREGAQITELIDKLQRSDFFEAPASTNYHCAFKGGLCYHSLNVYDQLKKLISIEYPDHMVDEYGEFYSVDNYQPPYSEDTLIIVALLHDLSKMNFYETAERNAKDESGNWIKVPFIKVRDYNNRFIYSSHGVNSEYMVGTYIPLSIEESAAIINHMGGKEPGAPTMDNGLSEIFNRYPLAILLHTADMLSTFFVERM